MYKKTLLTALIILGVLLCGNAFAGTKFINKDTAKDRKPIRMGTGGDNNQVTIQSDNDSNTIRVKPKQEDEEKESRQVGPIFVVPEIKP
ncbi:hypothetical protein [Maridesulfovibrio sp.]|uniref:hypothetical protein n=1 Tax=Maridesulfovibrio sp. TaxID=2795000 RepID=UPI002AA62F51|nr:hypothetical protein [Maridesulfovibrio sp.]